MPPYYGRYAVAPVPYPYAVVPVYYVNPASAGGVGAAPGSAAALSSGAGVVAHTSPVSVPVPVSVSVPVQHPHPHANNLNERERFYQRLHAFRAAIGQPIVRLPTLGFKELDLWTLYREVTRRHGIDAVIARKQWKEVAEALRLPSSCTDSGFRLRLHYKKYLEAFERKYFKPSTCANSPATGSAGGVAVVPTATLPPVHALPLASPRRKKRRLEPPASSCSVSASEGGADRREKLQKSQSQARERKQPPTTCAHADAKNARTPPCSPVRSEDSNTYTASASDSVDADVSVTGDATARSTTSSTCTDNASASRVDLGSLSTASLRRYVARHKLHCVVSSDAATANACDSGRGTQIELAHVVNTHFAKLAVTDSECSVIAQFTRLLRSRRAPLSVAATADHV